MWIFTPRLGIRRLPQNLLLAAEKKRNCPFLLHLHLIQVFSDSFLILAFIKQNLVAASYGSVLSPLHQSLTQDNLRAHCAVFLIIVIFFDITMIFSSLMAKNTVFSCITGYNKYLIL